jgi:ribosome-binding ATPase YchF (GTP1/OBG family)
MNICCACCYVSGPPELLFVGRSNVGKSSLVNMLVNRKALAPTSSKPGFTTTLNFYGVNTGRDRYATQSTITKCNAAVIRKQSNVYTTLLAAHLTQFSRIGSVSEQ